MVFNDAARTHLDTSARCDNYTCDPRDPGLPGFQCWFNVRLTVPRPIVSSQTSRKFSICRSTMTLDPRAWLANETSVGTLKR